VVRSNLPTRDVTCLWIDAARPLHRDERGSFVVAHNSKVERYTCEVRRKGGEFLVTVVQVALANTHFAPE